MFFNLMFELLLLHLFRGHLTNENDFYYVFSYILNVGSHMAEPMANLGLGPLEPHIYKRSPSGRSMTLHWCEILVGPMGLDFHLAHI